MYPLSMLVFYVLCVQYNTMFMYMYTGMYINKNFIIYKCKHASLYVHVQVWIERINHDTRRKIISSRAWEKRRQILQATFANIFVKLFFLKKKLVENTEWNEDVLACFLTKELKFGILLDILSHNSGDWEVVSLYHPTKKGKKRIRQSKKSTS